MSAALRTTNERASRTGPVALDHEVVIIGSGFSGIGAAVALQKMGIQDFLILEREQRPGGTWVQHDYPGLEVDMPFFTYCYPFETKPDWSHLYPSGAELREYTLHCIEAYDLARSIRCASAASRAEYDAASNVWRVGLESGEVLVTRYLVNATGLLVIPKLPEIDGIDAFEGKLIHTARWDHDFDAAGKRIAVIGTGATAIQLIPALAEGVKRLDVYQRTPIWMMPKPNPQLSPGFQRALRAAPMLQTLLRWIANLVVEIMMGLGLVRYARFPWIFGSIERKLVEYIRSEVRDPAVQEKLIPRYTFFCKRPSFSNTYYATFNRPNVELVTQPIARVTKNAIVTTDGREREIDALVCATGYQVFNRRCVPGYEIIGREGRNLGEFWQEHRFQAYEGATVPGFPNLFLFMGPYSTAGLSYFTMIDTESKHMTRCLRAARKRGANYIEVRRQAHERDFAKIDRRRRATVFFAGSCAGSNSYYFDERGDTPGLRPVSGLEHWWRSRFFSLKDYLFEQRGS
jgi:cation diffusion facilitator CzcD-associated flavoprotein CzcO